MYILDSGGDCNQASRKRTGRVEVASLMGTGQSVLVVLGLRRRARSSHMAQARKRADGRTLAGFTVRRRTPH